jgi:hypothetical protein
MKKSWLMVKMWKLKKNKLKGFILHSNYPLYSSTLFNYVFGVRLECHLDGDTLQGFWPAQPRFDDLDCFEIVMVGMDLWFSQCLWILRSR